MKKTIPTFILTAILALIAGTTASAQSGNCDLVFDFESGTYTGNNVTFTVETNPYTTGINTSNTCLKITKTLLGNNADVIILPITIPAGKTLAEAFTSVKVQFASVSGELYGKPTFVGVSDDGSTWSNTYSGIDQPNLGTAWIERTISISNLNSNLKNKTGNVSQGIGLGAWESNTIYYMDNIT